MYSAPDFIEDHLRSRDAAERRLQTHMREKVQYVAHSGDLIDRATGKVLTKHYGKGHGIFKFEGETFSSASAVWFWHHGTFPPGVRFKRANGNVRDDRIENLGFKTMDGSLEGFGSRWAVKVDDVRYGPFKSYEKALSAYEAMMGLIDISDLV